VTENLAPDKSTLKRGKLPPVPQGTAGGLRAPWRGKSACDNYDNDNPEFAGDFTRDYDKKALKRTRKKCASCPVWDYCLSDALRDKEAHGMRAGFYFILGGLDPESREIIKELYGRSTRGAPETE